MDTNFFIIGDSVGKQQQHFLWGLFVNLFYQRQPMVGYGIKGSLRACFIHQNYAIGVLQSFIYHHSQTKFLIFKGVPEMHFYYRHINEYSR